MARAGIKQLAESMHSMSTRTMKEVHEQSDPNARCDHLDGVQCGEFEVSVEPAGDVEQAIGGQQEQVVAVEQGWLELLRGQRLAVRRGRRSLASCYCCCCCCGRRDGARARGRRQRTRWRRQPVVPVPMLRGWAGCAGVEEHAGQAGPISRSGSRTPTPAPAPERGRDRGRRQIVEHRQLRPDADSLEERGELGGDVRDLPLVVEQERQHRARDEQVQAAGCVECRVMAAVPRAAEHAEEHEDIRRGRDARDAQHELQEAAWMENVHVARDERQQRKLACLETYAADRLRLPDALDQVGVCADMAQVAQEPEQVHGWRGVAWRPPEAYAVVEAVKTVLEAAVEVAVEVTALGEMVVVGARWWCCPGEGEEARGRQRYEPTWSSGGGRNTLARVRVCLRFYYVSALFFLCLSCLVCRNKVRPTFLSVQMTLERGPRLVSLRLLLCVPGPGGAHSLSMQ